MKYILIYLLSIFCMGVVIPTRDQDGNSITWSSPFSSAENFRFRGKGVAATITAGTTHNIDHKITEIRYITGVQIILINNHKDDKVHFEIVDVDNVLGYGAGFVIDRFGEDWYFATDTQDQHPIIIPFPSKLPANLYIRVIYVSAGTTDVDVKINLFLYKRT